MTHFVTVLVGLDIMDWTWKMEVCRCFSRFDFYFMYILMYVLMYAWIDSKPKETLFLAS